MISTFTAFFDANVFFGAWLRSLILYAAQSGLFRARWSEEVHREWMQALIAKRPGLTEQDLAGTRRAMDAAVLDCLVTGYEALIPTLEFPDPDDHHILAAAIVGRADVIVTFNQADFPAEVLAPYRIHTRHPDQFLLDFGGIDRGALVTAAREDLEHYANPPLTRDTYIESLRKAGVPATADYLTYVRVLLAPDDEPTDP